MDSPPLTARQALLILNDLPNIGPVVLNRLLAEFGGDPVAVLRADRERLERVRGVGPGTSAAVAGWSAHFDLVKEEDWLARAGADYLVAGDAGYPALLRETADPPIALYRLGAYACGHPCVAIVGSRRTTLYGQGVARRLASDLARLGYCVVSGLARGIDTAAHEGALQGGGPTVAVLGTGLDLVYPPENVGLYRRIAETGAVLTEFPFGRRADRQSFAMRNRIVSGMSRAVVVVESDVDGGAMITARFAGEQGRLLFAVPGRIDQPTSAGCHQLLRDGATLFTKLDDLLEELAHFDGFEPGRIPPREGEPSVLETVGGGLGEDERRVLAGLADGSLLGTDSLAERTGLAAPAVASALLLLELKRLVARRADGTYEARGR